MSIIQWRDSYNTGVEQFDREHHKIIELIDLLYTCVRDQRESSEIAGAIAQTIEREKVREFYQFLRTWLVDHIVGCDKKYSGFLTQK